MFVLFYSCLDLPWDPLQLARVPQTLVTVCLMLKFTIIKMHHPRAYGYAKHGSGSEFGMVQGFFPPFSKSICNGLSQSYLYLAWSWLGFRHVAALSIRQSYKTHTNCLSKRNWNRMHKLLLWSILSSNGFDRTQLGYSTGTALCSAGTRHTSDLKQKDCGRVPFVQPFINGSA